LLPRSEGNVPRFRSLELTRRKSRFTEGLDYPDLVRAKLTLDALALSRERLE